MAELTDKERFERLERGLVHSMQMCPDPLCTECADLLAGLPQPQPAPEPTAFRKYMADVWPGILVDSTRWVEMRAAWNAAIDAAVGEVYPRDVGQLERDIFALKEPEA